MDPDTNAPADVEMPEVEKPEEESNNTVTIVLVALCVLLICAAVYYLYFRRGGILSGAPSAVPVAVGYSRAGTSALELKTNALR